MSKNSKNINPGKFASEIKKLKAWCAKFWGQPLQHPHFTIHGVAHSESILGKILKWLEPSSVKLTNSESFILMGAVYLHDIGMQCRDRHFLETYAQIEPKEIRMPLDSEASNKVRKHHGLLSSEMIRDGCKIQTERKYPDLGLDCFNHPHEYEAIALLARGHVGDIPPEVENDCRVSEGPVRLKMLQYLLRVGDALDADAARINSQYAASAWSAFPPLDKFHTLKHQFVANIEIVGSGIFRFNYKIPDTLKKHFDIIRQCAEAPLRKHFQELGPCIPELGIPFTRVDFKQLDGDASLPFPMDEEMVAYFRKEAASSPPDATPTPPKTPSDFKAAPSMLWKHQTGPGSVFEGRDEELADLDRDWAAARKGARNRARILTLHAIGGAGKTTLVSRWKDALLNRSDRGGSENGDSNHGDSDRGGSENGGSDHGGVERYFDWSFYNQGTRREGDNATAQSAADSTAFVVAALRFFADDDPDATAAEVVAFAESPASAWDKGARLAALVSRRRTLLVLDGLEPLQHPPGPQQGALKDDAIRALFEGLKTTGLGLCVVTTREPVADLAPTEKTTTPCRPLNRLSDIAGAAVLRAHGVVGSQEELEAASREVKGHALTISLMGRYLKMAFRTNPDIARRDCFKFGEADRELSEVREGQGHAFRVMAAYERWFEENDRPVELAILRLLGLFDRPATPDCIAALCAEPAIHGLTEPLVGLRERKWTIAINRLLEIDLIATLHWKPMEVSGYGEDADQKSMGWEDLGPPKPFPVPSLSFPVNYCLDAHPLLREYFDAQLRQDESPNPHGRTTGGVAAVAHARLYEHLCNSVPYWPEGREGLQPLYQAVAHGCKAGKFQSACSDVYRDRILRGTVGAHANYSTFKLGLQGQDLGAVACFFLEPWTRVVPDLNPDAQAWLLNEAATRLRALNRLAEAREPMRAGLEMRKRQGNWENAALSASNLSELELVLGDVSDAVETAVQSVEFGDRSGDASLKTGCRTTHADALHQAGGIAESRERFVEAEAMQKNRHSEHPMLYSLQGYRYCDFLLSAAERAAWRRFLPPPSGGWNATASGRPPEDGTTRENLDAIEQRATRTLEWAIQNRASLLTIALDHLTLGRVRLFRALFASPDTNRDSFAALLAAARTPLNEALDTLRKANISDHLPRALLSCAWMHAAAGEWDAARQRLDEAHSVATRGVVPPAQRENDAAAAAPLQRENAATATTPPQQSYEGGMRLHLIDTLLHRVRLFGLPRVNRCGRGSESGSETGPEPGRTPSPPTYPWLESETGPGPGRTPRMDLDEAAALIERCGYHRRDAELDDIRAVLPPPPDAF